MLRTFVGADIILLLSFFLQFWLLVSYLLCYIFERTYVLKEQGCSITMLVSEEQTIKNSPQGAAPGSFKVPVDTTLLKSFHEQVEQAEPQPEESLEAATLRIQELIADENENGDVDLM